MVHIFYKAAKKSCGFLNHVVQFMLKEVPAFLCFAQIRLWKRRIGCEWFSADSGVWLPHFVGLEVRGRGMGTGDTGKM